MGHWNRLKSILCILLACVFLIMPGTNEAWANSSEGEVLFEQGKAHHDGDGVPRDFSLARAYYEQAAALGNSDAQLNLGYLYFVGEGVKRDFVKARSWYEKATKSGNLAAAENLKFMNREGLGLAIKQSPAPVLAPQNKPEAKTSSKLAVATTEVKRSKAAQTRKVKRGPPPKQYHRALVSNVKATREAHLLSGQSQKMARQKDIASSLGGPNFDHETASSSNVVAAASQKSSVLSGDKFGLSYSYLQSLFRKPADQNAVFQFGGLFLVLTALITGIRIFLTDNRKRQSKKLALEFFEQNRTPLREIYLRYPPDASTLTDRNSNVATSFSVLIVRFLLSGKKRASENRFPRSSDLSKQILDLVYVHPARARHLAATCLPETLKLIESDIRAFDKEQERPVKRSTILDANRNTIHKKQWLPRLISNDSMPEIAVNKLS